LTEQADIGFDCEALLASAICHLIRDLGADFVPWLQPDAVLDAQEFNAVVSQVVPRRVQNSGQTTYRPACPALPLIRTPAFIHEPGQTGALPDKIGFRRRFPDVEVTSFAIASEYDRRKNGPDRSAVSPEFGRQELYQIYQDNTDAIPAPKVNSTARLANYAVALTVAVISLPIGALVLTIN